MISVYPDLPNSVAQRITPLAVPYRELFARGHVPQVLGDVREVLAVRAIIENVGGQVPLEDKFRLLDQFFDQDLPDNRCWLPLSIRPRKVVPAHWRLDTLSDFLASLKDESDAGVLLMDRTGAGKTLACLKAFRDCFLPVRDKTRNGDWVPHPLVGHLPIRLPVGLPVPAAKVLGSSGSDNAGLRRRLLRELLIEAGLPVGVDGCHRDGMLAAWDQVDEWTRDSPPILLFVDLNAADHALRPHLATALGRWQAEHGRDRRHRVIVTYRSATGQDDSAVNQLLSLAPWTQVELAPIQPEQAVKYLVAHRQLEWAFCERLQTDPPRRALRIEEESNMLGEFLSNWADHESSLVSTPLLMHLATTLKNGLSGVHTLSDLYGRVIDQTLERDLRPGGRHSAVDWPSLLQSSNGPRAVKVVMTRVSLAILAEGADNTRLRGTLDVSLDELVAGLVQRPEEELNGLRWQGEGPFWGESVYQTEKFGPAYDRAGQDELHQALLEVGLFRREENALAFLHDSLIDYCAGKFALRDYRGPGDPFPKNVLAPEWSAQVVERVLTNPRAWERAAEFLGGTLAPAQLRELALRLLWAPPRPKTEGLASFLHHLLRGRRRKPETGAGLGPLLAELEDCTWRFEGRRYPDAFPSIARHWLRDRLGETPECEAFLEDHETAMNDAGRHWLEADPPPRSPEGRWHRLHRDAHALVQLEDGRIASGGTEGYVVVWSPSRGDSNVVHRHKGEVRFLVALKGGGLASVGDDRHVVVLAPGERLPCVVYHHDSSVTCLIALSNGGLASGDQNGCLKTWTREKGDRAFPRSKGAITCLIELPNDRLAFGTQENGQGVVHVAEVAAGTTIIAHTHAGGVQHLVSWRDGGLVSGGEKGDLRVWPASPTSRLPGPWRDSPVSALTTLSDGSVLAGHDDGSIVWAQIGTAPQIDPNAHAERVTCLIALKDGGWASASRDGMVKVWETIDQPPRTIHDCGGTARCLVPLPGGGLACGGRDGRVAIWRSGDKLAAVVHEHGGERVLALAALAKGGVVSGGQDGKVQAHFPKDSKTATGRAPQKSKPHAFVTADFPRAIRLKNDRWATGHVDGSVRVRSEDGAERLIHTHAGDVTCLVELAAGVIASGGSEGTILVNLGGDRPSLALVTYEPVADLEWRPADAALVASLRDGSVLRVRLRGPNADRWWLAKLRDQTE